MVLWKKVPPAHAQGVFFSVNGIKTIVMISVMTVIAVTDLMYFDWSVINSFTLTGRYFYGITVEDGA
jgi:hypothetical protein